MRTRLEDGRPTTRSYLGKRQHLTLLKGWERENKHTPINTTSRVSHVKQNNKQIYTHGHPSPANQRLWEYWYLSNFDIWFQIWDQITIAQHEYTICSNKQIWLKLKLTNWRVKSVLQTTCNKTKMLLFEEDLLFYYSVKQMMSWQILLNLILCR